MKKDKSTKPKKKMGVLGKTFTVLGVLLGAVIVALSSYVIYVFAQFYRIEDNQVLEVNRPRTEKLDQSKSYTYTSFNVGFGAYSYDYTFFLDKGVEADGTLNTGYHSKALSKEEGIKNINGCIEMMKSLDSDFYGVQEVDLDSTRAYHVNQVDMISGSFKNYCETYAINFHSAFLAYPLYDFHGASTAGLLTLSKYNVEKSVRKSYTVSDAFPDKFMDLDRCFSANYIPTNTGKYLVLINSHMSAYDEGGKIRNKQITELNNFMKEEYDKGNYIIAGGDFNHDLLTNNPQYHYTKEDRCFKELATQLMPPWVSFMFDENGKTRFDDCFSIIADDRVPTCRGVDIPYELGHTYVTTVDGFIVSDNVKVEDVKASKVACTESPMFSYSDHQPTTLTFKLI